MEALAPIAAHGVVGDGRAAALIGDDGTVAWLCWPRFDSPALFAALLHDRSAGAWTLRPAGEGWRTRQRYVGDSNVLETTFERPGAALTLTDLMPVTPASDARRLLQPEHELLRIATCTQGTVELVLQLRLAPGYGTGRVRLHESPTLGLRAETREGALFLRCERLRPGMRDGELVASTRLQAGERVRCSLTWSAEAPAVLPPLGGAADAAVERTVRWWEDWARRCRYEGPFRTAVVRSALALKLLCYPPSGAILAAATTSLPECQGGALNWDYRYCWLRDAAFTVRALDGLGYREEADAFVHWLMHTTRLTQPALRVLYDVYGNAPGRERILGRLRGYGGASPVRVGNAAEHQLQLDVHGEVIDAVCAHAGAGGELDRETRRMLAAFGRYVCEHWAQPDAGLWELRGEPRHFTHSKVLGWTALDRLLTLCARVPLPGLDLQRARTERARIHERVWREAWNPRLGAYASTLGGQEPDAALLLLPWYGFEPPEAPRSRATLHHVLRSLDAGAGLLYRNPELRAAGDGAFVACGFWAAELLARGSGSLQQAQAWFSQMLGHASPLGLYAEEVDPATGAALGNFPQAYSHVGLISAALALEERRARELGTVAAALREPVAQEVRA